MKNLRKVLVIAVCLCVAFCFTGCGSLYSGVNLEDYIKVGKYTGLTVASFKVSVSDSDVTKYINDLRDAAKSTKMVTTGTVKKGDTVEIDYVGKINGEEFDGGSGDGYYLTIGSGTFIDGFETGLIGKKIGSTVKLNLTFPTSYKTADLAGKDVVFTVTIVAKQQEVVPTVEEYMKENTEYTSVKEFRKAVKEQLEESEKTEGEDKQKETLWKKVVKSSKVQKDDSGVAKYVEKAVNSKVDSIVASYESYMENNGSSLDTYLESLEQTEEEFKESLKSSTYDTVKEEEIAYYIADKEGLSVSNSEYKEALSNAVTNLGYEDDAAFKEVYGTTYEKYVGKDNLMATLLIDKVQDFILSKAKIK